VWASCDGRFERDQGAGDLNEREIVVGNSLPADEQSAELVVPGVGPFNHPSAGLAADAPNHPPFTPSADVRHDSTPSNLVLAVGVVVALVQAKMFGAPWSAAAAKYGRVECRPDHPLVVPVRAGDDHRQWNAAGICQDVPFRAGFRTIGRIGAGEVPPFGAFTVALSIEHQVRSTPTCWS
jgi:hypothetical protein